METRPPAAEMIKGLTTTADKIRALAQTNYNRTEISKMLDIRYRHVRNVLLRSGIEGGLRRQVEVEREPVTVDAEWPQDASVPVPQGSQRPEDQRTNQLPYLADTALRMLTCSAPRPMPNGQAARFGHRNVYANVNSSDIRSLGNTEINQILFSGNAFLPSAKS
jgi:hypothetical protein